MPNEAEVLKHDADAAAILRECLARRFSELAAEEANPTARRPLRQIEQLQERRLSRSGRAGEEIEAALPQAEIEVAQHFCASAVAQADAVEFGNVGQFASPPAA